jgi:hypothetical protein
MSYRNRKPPYGEFTGDPYNRKEPVSDNAKSNLEFRGTKPVPRQFTPILSFGGSDEHRGTLCNVASSTARTKQGVGQPDESIFISTRPMKK